jgi:ABC-type dipeptide/oligopeptide/nickel transport system permease component
MTIVLERVPATLRLALAALSLAIVFGLGLGILAALSPSKSVRFLLSALAVVGQSIPVFFLGLVALLIFAAQLKLLPAFGGAGDAKAMILPAIVLSLLPMARIARLSRAGMTEALHQDYVLTALSKGLSRRRVVLRDCLPNVLIPIVTLAGYDLVQLFGTQVVAEVVFTWPGLGSQLVTSASQRDYNVVQAIAFVTATAAVLISLIVDMTYRMLDPRIKEANLG